MADKQQNIVINFEYRTAGLEKGTQLVNRADEANKKLQESAQKAGRGVSNAYRGATQSIGAMQIQLARLKTQIEVSTNPQKVKQLSDQYKQLKSELDKVTKSAFDTSKALNEVNKTTGSLSTSMGLLGKTLAAAISVEAAKRAISLTLEMAKLSGTVEGVERAFHRLPNATLLLDDLRKSTHNTVTDLELMQKTLMAQNYKIPLQNLGKLLEFASVKAQQTGQDVNHLVDYIVTGIGLRSVRRLDDLGFTASRLKDALGGVTVQSATMGQVMNAVTKLMDEDLKRTGGFVNTTAVEVEQLSTNWSKLGVNISKALTSPGLLKFYNDVVKGLDFGVRIVTEGGADNVVKGDIAKEKALADIRSFRERELTSEVIADRQKAFDIIQDELNAQIGITATNNQRLRETKEWIADMERFRSRTASEEDKLKSLNMFNQKILDISKQRNVTANEAADILLEHIEDIKKSVTSYEIRNLRIQEYMVLLKEARKEFEEGNKVQEEELGIIERKKNEIEAIQEAIEKTNNRTDLSSRRTVGKLINDLAVAQAELKELTEGVESIEFNVKFDLSKLKQDVKRETQLIRASNKDGAEFFIEVPIKPVLNKSKAQKDFEALVDLTTGLNIPIPVKPMVITGNDFWGRLGQAFSENQQELIQGGIDITTDLLKGVEQAEIDSLQNRMNNLRNFYDEQILLAGDNDRAKQQLRLKEEQETAKLQKKMAEREKRIRSFNVVIDTAASIAKTAAQLGFPAAIPFIALAAATGLAQLATINRTPARFAKGVIDLQGPGTGTSDSISARLSKGESVMTAKETQNSKGILKEIRAKRLDDKVLQDLRLTKNGVSYQPTNIEPVVKELRAIRESQPDLIEQNGKLYRQYTKSKIHKVRTRVKIMGS